MFPRHIDIDSLLRHKSLFLLGPRQAGQSTFLRHQFPSARCVDLLEPDTYRQLSAHPETLRHSLTPADRPVVIDEVQKLRGGQVNLLAGRAWATHLLRSCRRK